MPVIRAVDHEIATGVYPDMTEHGWERDDWPAIFEQIMAADILVLMTPIWLGEKSSVCTRVIERLYGNSAQLNEQGQYAYYGRAGGCWSPAARTAPSTARWGSSTRYSTWATRFRRRPTPVRWEKRGPGRATSTRGRGGPDNDFTNRNTTFMTWNLLHVARMLRDNGGIPAHGNQRAIWDKEYEAHHHDNPEHR